MRVKTKAIAEFGDFQTPSELAQSVCRLLSEQGLRPASILEPTCGLGSFLFAGLDVFSVTKAIGADVNGQYIQRAATDLERRSDKARVELAESDFFATDWKQVVEDLPEPVLVVGNLPWVTNAHLCAIGSQNLPVKSNFQNHNGFDAITGKANFDISEWMLMQLLESMNERRGMLAMLCKATVARKALCHAWKNEMQIGNSAMYRIDAATHFDAAVDAVLLVIQFEPEMWDCVAQVYPSLNDKDSPTWIGYEDDTLLADLSSYHRWKHLRGDEWLKWRSGVKHDCSKVMELRRAGGSLWNGFGESVEIEETYLYPMLKSSDLASCEQQKCDRRMLVTQKAVGEDTSIIRKRAPKTWAYLERHAELLNKRGSIIYRKQPPFAVFGVGDYSFSPWKVAISGFYKKLNFKTVGPIHGKPVVLDDTAYFLSCQSPEQAAYLADLLNSAAAQDFYRAFIFWDGKRPITVELLRKLDLRRIAVEMSSESTFDRYFNHESLPLFTATG